MYLLHITRFSYNRGIVMDSKTTQFCPHCGEAISTKAKECRFCTKSVCFQLQWVKRVPKQNRASLAKTLVEQGMFLSFKDARQALENKSTSIGAPISGEEKDNIARIIEKYGGIVQSVHAKNKPNPSSMVHFALTACMLIVLGLGTGYYIQNQKTQPEEISQNWVEEEDVLQEIYDQSIDTAPVSPRGLDIQSLLQSTATVIGEGTTGSAFFVHPEGYLVTNHHVTQNMKNIMVQTFDQKNHPATLIKFDPKLDLSLLKIQTGYYPPIAIGDATQLQPGDTVITIGAPHGLSFTVTKGIISFVGRMINGNAYIQADVAINPGNSGGPMINEFGELVGINNFIITQSQGLNFAIPSNYLFMGSQAFLREILAIEPNNSVMTSWLTQKQTFHANAEPSTTQPTKQNNNAIENTQQTISILSKQLEQLNQEYVGLTNSAHTKIQDLTVQMKSTNQTISGQTKLEKEIQTTKKQYYQNSLVLNRRRAQQAKQIKSEYEKLARQMQQAGQNNSQAHQATEKITQVIQGYETLILEAQQNL